MAIKTLSLPLVLAVGLVLPVAGCQERAADPVAAPVPSAADMPAPVAEPAVAINAEPAREARRDGWAGTRFGMDVAAFEAAWDGRLSSGDVMPGSTCVLRIPAGAEAPPALSFMFEDGRFVRYDVLDPDVTAPGGGKVGMRLADIERLYPIGLEHRGHAYVQGGHYLRTVRGEDVLLFEVDADGRVTQWRAGRAPQVDYVEGCS